jgi:hypothetical protein
MTVAGIHSGLFDPYGGGFPTPLTAVVTGELRTSDAQAVELIRTIGGRHPGQPAIDTEDTLELSPAALGKELETAQSETELSEEEQVQLEALRQRDQDVRAHENAHQAAAGPYAQGGVTFEYQTGPDGKRYAIGGEVTIDTTPVDGDPQATIAKMEQVRAAALAPPRPSAQDRAVAAQAAAVIQEAQLETARERVPESDDGEDNTDSPLHESDLSPPARTLRAPSGRLADPDSLAGTLLDTFA